MSHQDQPPVANPPHLPDEGPERFDPQLLTQSRAKRLAWFEHQCLIEHARLEQACEAILRTICSPGEGEDLARLATMVLVIGPARVGKTTLIAELQTRLLGRAKERMLRDPSHRPYVSVSAPEEGMGRFNWRDYYLAVLRQVNHPFVSGQKKGVQVRDLREAMEEALIQHQPYAVIVDEAHHLAKAGTGRGLQDQLDHLKDLENRTGVCHILVGTYEMRRFRTLTPQLAGRGTDIHFSRYDAKKKEDREEFRSALWALQRQLPVSEEPLLAQQHWESLYARSIGCVGLLKLHLNRALALALTQGSQTVTKEHLEATALPEGRLKEMLGEVLKGEAELAEPDGADERLLEALGMRESQATPARSALSSARQGKTKPGERSPGRDPIGTASDTNSEQAVG
jgi:hypothetical protein